MQEKQISTEDRIFFKYWSQRVEFIIRKRTWKGAHTFHLPSLIYTSTPPHTEKCLPKHRVHEKAIALERKQGKQQNNQKSLNQAQQLDTELSSKEYTGHNQRSGK